MKKNIATITLCLLSYYAFAQEGLKPYVSIGGGLHSTDATSLNAHYINGFVSRFDPPWFEEEMRIGGSTFLRVGLRPNKGFGYFFEYNEFSSALKGDISIDFTDVMGVPLYTITQELQLKMSLVSSKLGLTYSLPIRDRLLVGGECAMGYAKGELRLTSDYIDSELSVHNESYSFYKKEMLYQGALRMDYQLSRKAELPLSLTLAAGYHVFDGDGPKDRDGEEWVIHYPDNVPKRVDIEMTGVYAQLMLTVGI